VQDKAALTRASLKRGVTGEIIPLNLYDVLVKGLQPPPIKLEDGDLIVVPAAQERVTVQGAVGRPGYYDIEDGKILKLSEVIALAGGPVNDAAITRTIVQHSDNTSQVVDLYKILALHDEASNVALRNDDIITVPKYSPQVIIAGSGIRSASYVPIDEGTTLRVLGALTKAGGLSEEPEATKITITRNMPGAVPTLDPAAQPVQPTILTVDPIKLYKQNDLDSNIALQDGDVIMVTTEPRKIYLAGEVRSPGAYEIEANEGLTEVLTRAGGITEDGLLSGVIVERGGNKMTIDAFGALNRGDNVDFPLQAGDNIVVPKNMNRVLVLPAVGQPGYHAIPEDRPMTVPEALNLAKGTSGDALLKRVVLLRSTPQGLQPEPLPLDTADQWVKASKVIMKPGDILFVPGRQPREGSNLGSKVLRLLPFATMALGSPFPLF
jgi:protein involved in polysaccharide export with SLBB domain